MKEYRTTNNQHRTLNETSTRAYQELQVKTNRKIFDLEQRLLEFACSIIDVSENLPNSRAGNHVAGQLLRSGTSPYSNHGQAESAESPEDFIHKMKVCLKELRETRRWLRLIDRKRWLAAHKELQFTMSEVEELIRIFVASIRTAQGNRQRAAEAQKQLKTMSAS